MSKSRGPENREQGLAKAQQGHSGSGHAGHVNARDRAQHYGDPRRWKSHEIGSRNGTPVFVAPQRSGQPFDLAAAALAEVHAAGFTPEFSSAAEQQVVAVAQKLAQLLAVGEAEDLRALGWSSIDNDTSKDLDQIEVADRVSGGVRLRVAIGDVAAAVEKDSPIDEHAKAQTQTIYTAVKNFPMIPSELSTGLTSLNEDADRQAILMTFTVSPEGALLDETVGRALVRNRAQLAYSRVGPWLEAAGRQLSVEANVFDLRSDSAREGHAENAAMNPTHDGDKPAGATGVPGLWLSEQLELQDEAAQSLHKARLAAGALEFHKGEADPVVADGKVIGVTEATQNRAMNLIEDLMVAANGVMARALRKGGRSGLQRVVRVPARWDRIVALAKDHGGDLPDAPDSVALNNFLTVQRKADPDHYPDLAVATIKLLGPGEYMLMRPDDDPTGHFGLAARDYTHSTAPNRRFPDLVTQRVLHAMIAAAPAPYSDDDLTAIAAHCNEADKSLRKIERDMQKRVAAVAMAKHIGETFRAVVTGASDKGVYARVIAPPFEGRIVTGGDGLDVGDRVQVKLTHTDPARAFIDFARA